MAELALGLRTIRHQQFRDLVLSCLLLFMDSAEELF